jgi:hypothetical protein
VSPRWSRCCLRRWVWTDRRCGPSCSLLIVCGLLRRWHRAAYDALKLSGPTHASTVTPRADTTVVHLPCNGVREMSSRRSRLAQQHVVGRSRVHQPRKFFPKARLQLYCRWPDGVAALDGRRRRARWNVQLGLLPVVIGMIPVLVGTSAVVVVAEGVLLFGAQELLC